MKFRKFAIAAIGAALFASCTSTPGQEVRSPRAQKELADALRGRVAGAPERCIPNYSTTHMQVIDDWTILFHEGRKVYVQNPRGGCRGLGIGSSTLVIRQFGSNQICENDFNQLADLRTGFQGGSCVFGPFVPYTKVR